VSIHNRGTVAEDPDLIGTLKLVGGSRTCCTISMEILPIYKLKDWKEDLSSYGKGQLSMKTL
jgi:hypothetical protein